MTGPVAVEHQVKVDARTPQPPGVRNNPPVFNPTLNFLVSAHVSRNLSLFKCCFRMRSTKNYGNSIFILEHDSLSTKWKRIKDAKGKTVADLAAALKIRFQIERGFSPQNLGDLIADTEDKSPEKKKMIRLRWRHRGRLRSGLKARRQNAGVSFFKSVSIRVHPWLKIPSNKK